MRLFIAVVVQGGKSVSIKMRNNSNPDAVCCECGEGQKEVLNMFDLCIGGNIFTICDVCNDKIFNKCLSAEVMKNGRVKSKRDLQIINRRKLKSKGPSWGDYNK